MRSLLVLLFMTSPAFPDDVRSMLEQKVVKQELARLVITASGMKMCDAELAAFVVRLADGKRAVIPWNTDCATMKKTYRGIIPPNTVAIAHTHPDQRPLPSAQDLEEAKRTRIPICVLTRRGVWMADPVAKKPVMLLDDPKWTVR